MNKVKCFLLFICFLSIFISCKNINTPTVIEPTPTPCNIQTQGKYWYEITPVPFGARSNFATINYENMMWVIGGKDEDDYYNDVWRSSNGIDWLLITTNANFTSRADFAVNTFNGYIWVIGGQKYNTDNNNYEYYNDVWKSNDGMDWVVATTNASFHPRSNFISLSYNNYMWVIGGIYQYSYYNDVWKSNNGVDWILVTGNANFLPRSSFVGFVFNNEIWIIGGYAGTSYLKDIWKTKDGINWTLVNENPPFSKRHSLQGFVHNNEIWIIGGYDTNYKYTNDVWKSKDGINWTLVISGADFSSRLGHCALSFRSKLFVLCGKNQDTYFNDIWYSE